MSTASRPVVMHLPDPERRAPAKARERLIPAPARGAGPAADRRAHCEGLRDHPLAVAFLAVFRPLTPPAAGDSGLGSGLSSLRTCKPAARPRVAWPVS
jgi:hypothetical protein